MQPPRTRQRAAAALCALLGALAWAPWLPAQARQEVDASGRPGVQWAPNGQALTLDLSRAGATFTLEPRAFGTNIPEDRPSRAWDDKGWKQKLSSAGISVLRFPGGETGDAYDWRSNSMAVRAEWAEDDDAEPPSQRMDYKALLKLASQLDARRLSFVVNVEGGLSPRRPLREQLERKAEEAAQWVAEVKASGAFVPYWEIGNESYLKSTTYPLTAQEYATAVALFARKMKAADPRIRIGANGPADWDAPGFLDQLAPQALDAFRQNVGESRRACKESVQECVEDLGGKKNQARSPKWWQVLAREAGRDIDFAAIHVYYHVDNPKAERPAALGLPTVRSGSLSELQAQWRQATGRPLELALTEWNNFPGKPGAAQMLSTTRHFMLVAESMLATTAAGVQWSAYWPLRVTDNNRRPRIPLLPQQGPASVLKLTGLLNEHFHGEVLEQSGALSRDLLALVVRRGTELELAFLNLGRDRRVRIEGARCSGQSVARVSLVTEAGPQPGASTNVQCRDGRLAGFDASLAQGELTWVQLSASRAN